MLKRLMVAATLLGAGLASFGSACGDDSGTGGATDCTTVKGYAELSVAFSKCTNCHSSALTTPTERQSAPDDFNYDTYELAKQFLVEIREQVEDDEMPPSGSPTLTTTEKNDMLTWADCDAPP